MSTKTVSLPSARTYVATKDVKKSHQFSKRPITSPSVADRLSPSKEDEESVTEMVDGQRVSDLVAENNALRSKVG